MSVGSLTLAVAFSVALGSIVAVSAWLINDALDDRRDTQTIFSIALAYRDHMTTSRCTLPSTALSLSAVRALLTAAGQSHAVVEDESAWHMTFDGGVNRQSAVTVFKVDGTSNITRSNTFTLPVAGGDRSHEFFDVVFDSRVCP
ncbi:MAG: hypothetical protein OXG15_06345 [Gammaproteobacteria bacterium]|nr:hypothetical protein [Gammaproteobacteria bacterium]